MMKKTFMAALGAMVLGLGITGSAAQAKTVSKPVTVKTVKSGLKVSMKDFYVTLPKSAWTKKNTVVKSTKDGDNKFYTFYDRINMKKYGGIVFSFVKTAKMDTYGDNQKVLAKKNGIYYIMYGPTDVEFAPKYMTSYQKKEATWKQIQKSVYFKDAYVNKKLGFKMDLPAQLYSKVSEAKMVTTKIGKYTTKEQHFKISVKDASYDVFCIGRVNKKLSAKKFDEIGGENKYIGTNGNKTYYMNINQESFKKYEKKYNDLINDYIVNLGTKIHYIEQ